MKNSNITLAVVAVMAAATMFTGTALATVTPPTGLGPGDQCQLIFVTADPTTATSADINYYNTFVQGEAALNPSLPSATWSAVASTADVAANVNAQTYYGIPIYNTLGQQVTSAYGAGLWTDPVTLGSPVQTNQFGASEAYIQVWTGAGPRGWQAIDDSPLCLGSPGGLNGAYAAYGESGYTDSGWIEAGVTSIYANPLDPSSPAISNPLYALSSVITVPVPEPGTLTLLGIGTGGTCRGSLSAAAVGRRRDDC
jgi:hypothetical protein